VRLALLADSHIPFQLPCLPEKLLERIAGVQLILHAGDLVTGRVLDELQSVAPTLAVAGNCDPRSLRHDLPERRTERLEEWTVGLAHGHQPHALQDRYIGHGYDDPAMALFYRLMREQLPEAEIIVFGHFHRPVVKRLQGVWFVNPGAVAPSYGRSTFALMTLGQDVSVEIVDLTAS